MNLLPLAENQTYDPNKLSIEVSDIWNFERSQLHNNPSYDTGFAIQLLNRIEDLIQAKSKPNFVVDRNSQESSYQLNKQSIHSSWRSDIKERYALTYFFIHDSYYSYSNEVEVSPTDDEFLFWFSLKLRQYDLSLHMVNDFLKFQLKRCSAKRGFDFFEMLDLCILQHPDFFSDRLVQMVKGWINRNKKEGPGNHFAQTSNDLKDSKKGSPRQHPKFIWIESANKEKQLQNLHSMLENSGYIDEIKLTNFKKHFNCYLDSVPKINWKSSQYGLIYLIDKLKPYLNSELYTGKDGTIAIAYFVKHFQYEGEEINIGAWRKVKSVNRGTENEITKHIDLIVSHL